MKREAGNKLDYEAFSGAAAELPRVKQVTNWIQGRRPRLWVSRSMLRWQSGSDEKLCCLLGPGDGRASLETTNRNLGRLLAV